MKKKELLVATGNKGKIRELKDLLGDDSSWHLHGLDEFPDVSEVEETGATFAENAILKAKGYARQTNLRALADDSGLEVEALDNAPGVFSARYGGENATDKDRIAKLLGELNSTNDSDRRARFVCVIAVADASGEIKFVAEGVCDGRIALKPCGENGFGYDPIFIPDGFEQTFGELADEIKRNISHRARAIKKIIRFLRDFSYASLDQCDFRL